MKTKRLALMAMAIALAMILSYVESQIPAFVAIPGIKMGLPNILVVFILYKLGWKDALAISLLRVFLVAVLFGSVLSLAYSFAGAAISFMGMLAMKKSGLFSTVAVSVAGGVLHNAAQIGVACLVMETNLITYYLPFLVLSGTIAGVVIGLASALMVKRVNIKL